MATNPTVEDRLLIEDLYGRYSWALDTGSFEGVKEVFADGAKIIARIPGGGQDVSEDPEKVEATMRGWVTDPAVVGRQHHVTTIIVDPDPEGRPDHWAVRTYFIVTESRATPPQQLVWCGYSRDVVKKVDGAFKLLVRDVGIWEGEVLAGFQVRDTPGH